MLGLSNTQVLLIIAGAFSVGMSKAGFMGVNMPMVALLALSFGARDSTGILLTMLIAGDIFSVIAYGKHGNFKNLIKVLPPAILGVAIGAFVGNYINDDQFRMIMGTILIACVSMLIYGEATKKKIDVSKNRWFQIGIGILSGFSTSIGNAAGPIFAVYLLALAYDKYKFLGTTAWFFFIINWIKVPFHIYMWNTITWETFTYTLLAIPFVLAGILLGFNIVKKINDEIFRKMIVALTAVVSVVLIAT